MNKNLFKSLEQALKKDSRFISNNENQILLKNVIRQAAEQLDETLISLLLDDTKLREVFFKPISDVIVFDGRKFITFLNNKEFLPDSYTAFKNKIGLSNTKGDYLSESDEVVLSFPYKDCVLAGGQDKEDTKRQEVFYNEVLGRDEIDRLLDPKTFTNFKKYTSAGEEKLSGFTRGEDGTIKDNLIIKGNNLLALHSLKKEFAGKVKLIYIDPPYNTGNDSFNYNDRFNHSTWLTFMKNRLEVSRELLREDGSIFISIDNNELSYLQTLMDEVFGIVNKQNIITVKRSSVSGAKVINNGLVNVSEFLIVYSKNRANWNTNRVFRKKERDKRYGTFIENFDKGFAKWSFCTVLEAFAKDTGIEKKSLKKHFGDEYENELDNFCNANSERIIQFVSLDEKSVSDAVLKLKKKSESDENIYHLPRYCGHK